MDMVGSARLFINKFVGPTFLAFNGSFFVSGGCDLNACLTY